MSLVKHFVERLQRIALEQRQRAVEFELEQQHKLVSSSKWLLESASLIAPTLADLATALVCGEDVILDGKQVHLEGLVEKNLRASVLERGEMLADRWPLDADFWTLALAAPGTAISVRSVPADPGLGRLFTVARRSIPLEERDGDITQIVEVEQFGHRMDVNLGASSSEVFDVWDWPIELAVKDVLEWTAKKRCGHPEPRRCHCVDPRRERALLRLRALRGEGSASSDSLPPWVRTFRSESLSVHAVVYLVEQTIREDLRQAAMAIDAGRAHHEMVTGMRNLPKDNMRHRGKSMRVSKVEERAELLAPDGGTIKIDLPIGGIEGLHPALIETVKRWRGWEGLRHWAAVLRLLSVEGARTGTFRWTLQAHLDALGYAPSTCEDIAVRRRVAAEVELFAKLELVVYWPNGTVRSRLPILMPTAKHDRLQGSRWELEGMELQINPHLYEGVRDPRTGKIGTNWYPQVAELARVDHVRHPHSLALGLILPIRWRWDWKDGRDFTSITGSSLLETAGIEFESRRASEAWHTLRRDLQELLNIKALGRYEWVGEPWTLAGIVRLYPPQWARDRTVHGLAPTESVVPKLPLNGRELREWREGKGWTQVETAERLGVSRDSIKRAEGSGDKKLTPAIMRCLQAFFKEASLSPPALLPQDTTDDALTTGSGESSVDTPEGVVAPSVDQPKRPRRKKTTPQLDLQLDEPQRAR